MALLFHTERVDSVFIVAHSWATQIYAAWRPNTWVLLFDSLMESNYVLWKVLPWVYFSREKKKAVMIWGAKHWILIYLAYLWYKYNLLSTAHPALIKQQIGSKDLYICTFLKEWTFVSSICILNSLNWVMTVRVLRNLTFNNVNII